MSPPSAFFLTLEGIDGAGKSSHLDWIAERLRRAGRVVCMTREPGGTRLAEALRTLMLVEDMDALSETLIVFAARRDHLRRVIEPALARGECVVCDRFTDATFAYQGGGRGVEEGVLQVLEGWVQRTRQPDLTLWFDLAPRIAAERRRTAREADRFESLDDAFFERVRQAYARRAAAAPVRFACIDGEAPPDAVRQALAAVLRERGLG